MLGFYVFLELDSHEQAISSKPGVGVTLSNVPLNVNWELAVAEDRRLVFLDALYNVAWLRMVTFA